MAFVLLLFGSLFSLTTLFPVFYSYIIALVTFGIASLYFLKKSRTFQAEKYSILSMVGIFLIFGWHAVTNPSGANIVTSASVRVIIFVPVFLITVFWIPSTLPHEQFVFAVTRIGGGLSILGLLVSFGVVPPFQSEELFGRPMFLAIFGPDIQVLTSIFNDSNFAGEFLSVAAILGLIEGRSYDNHAGYVFAGLNLVALNFTYSRAGYIAALGGIAVFWLLNRQYIITAAISTFSGIFGLAVFQASVVSNRNIPIDVTGREYLWPATINATLQRPLVGWGPGDRAELIRPYLPSGATPNTPHNSFLRFFLTSGIVGGVLYIIFTLMTIIFPLVYHQSSQERLLPPVVAVVILQSFGGFSILGLGAISVLSAAISGYALLGVNNRTIAR